MKPQPLHPDRRINVGSSEVAALFGCGFESYYELYHRKIGALPARDFLKNDRVVWGTVMEPAIAEGFRRMTGWNVRKVRRYVKHKTAVWMGASLDYEVIAHEDGPGVVEIKAVDRLVYLDWPEAKNPESFVLEDTDYGRAWKVPEREPPINYQLQLQHQIACTGRTWGVVVALVGGNDLKPYRFNRHDTMIEEMIRRIEEFRLRIINDDPPPIDWETDSAAVLALHRDFDSGLSVRLEDNAEANELAERYLAAMNLERMAKSTKLKSKARLAQIMGDAEKAYLANRILVTRRSGIRVQKLRRSKR